MCMRGKDLQLGFRTDPLNPNQLLTQLSPILYCLYGLQFAYRGFVGFLPFLLFGSSALRRQKKTNNVLNNAQDRHKV